MNSKRSLLSALLVGMVFVPNLALANPTVPTGSQLAPMGTGGTINTHDVQILKQNLEIKKRGRDFEQLKSNKKNKEKKSKDEEEINQEEPVVKAKVEEYATKGVYIEDVKITPSEILTQSEVDEIINSIKGKNIHFEELENVVFKINELYATKGYITAHAFLPVQTIEGGIVEIELIEGRVGRIVFDKNRWTKSSYIEKRLSSKPGNLFDIAKLEQDIVKFNRYNNGIKLNANLSPGEVTGTTDIKVEAKEEFPFHITGLMDNAGRETVGLLRGGLMLSSESLFGYRDRFAIGAYGSRSSLTPFADYNIPVNKYDGRVGVMVSTSNSEISSGPYEIFNIASRSYNYSAYYSHPLIRKQFFELNAVVSGHYKQATTSFDKYDLYTDKITAAQFALNARYDTKRGIWYASQSFYQAFPLISPDSKYFKYEGSLIRLHDFGHGIVGQLRGNYQFVPNEVIPYIDQYQSGGIASARGYSEGILIGKSGYLLSAELLFPIAPKEITLKVRDKENEQLINISNIPKVCENLEINFDTDDQPAAQANDDQNIKVAVKKTYSKKKVPFIGKYVKGVAFFDHAGVFPFKGDGPGAGGFSNNDFLVSMGLGLRVNLTKNLNARVYWAIPLLQNSHEMYKKNSRIHFELSLTPDFEALLKYRKRRSEVL